MKILLYGLNYAPEATGIGKYSGELGAWFSVQKHQVRAVSAPPYYPDWSVSKGYSNRFKKHLLDGVEVYRCPLYVPSEPSTIQRVLHLLSFMFSSSCALLVLLRWRPDVVINVVPAIFTSFPAWLYCRLTGAKFVIHVQDFESDAIRSLNMSRSNFLIKLWGGLERFILRKADIVSTISKAMIENAVKKGVSRSKLVFFPNWSEVSRFKDVQGVSEFKASMGFSDEQKIILYSGNIGRKQGLELVVETAKLAAQKHGDMAFVICGEGAAKKDLMNLVDELKLDNVYFFPLQPYSDLPRLLAMADVHLVVQNPGVENAVLPSKLTNILAVGGNAVITTNKETEIGRLIKNFPGIAIPVEPEDSSALLNGVELACRQKKTNDLAISYAERFLEKEAVLKKIETKLLNLRGLNK